MQYVINTNNFYVLHAHTVHPVPITINSKQLMLKRDFFPKSPESAPERLTMVTKVRVRVELRISFMAGSSF